MLRGLSWLCLTLCISLGGAVADEPAAASDGGATETKVMIRSGATGRFVFGRWGAVTGSVSNSNNSAARSLMVVTPSTGGLQYSRRIEVPARTIFDTTWPVLVTGKKAPGPVDFRYLHFPTGEDDGVIRNSANESELPSFSVLASDGPLGLTGYLPDNRSDERGEDFAMALCQAGRFNKLGVAGVASFLSRDISHHSECLDPLDALAVGDPRLSNYPMACDAIRAWLQRGGRLYLPLDVVGEDVVRTLLGELFPLTVVGETSSNNVLLELNPEYPKAQYPTRSVAREFDEPVRYLRIVPGTGEVIWSVDNWPVALRLPVGRGFVVITAIDSRVFVERRKDGAEGAPAWTTIASSRRMVDTLFDARPAPLISQPVAAEHAAALVGYQVPGRATAFVLLSVFPVLLFVVGGYLLRRSAGERLVWVVPALAVVAAVPALVTGMQIRSVAPNTLIETRVMMAGTGATDVVSDGFASVYLPNAVDLPVSSESGAVLDAQSDSANLDYRRLVWEGAAENHWEKLNQPAGLKTYPLRAVRKSELPFRITGTFDEAGFRATLLAPGFENASDFMMAGLTPDHLSLTRDSDGILRGTEDGVLKSGQYWSTTLTTEEQRQRTRLMESVFSNRDRTDLFPAEQSVLFWESSDKSLLNFTSDDLRVTQNTLMIQPIQWIPPEAGKLITILSPFMTMRSIETASGGFGGMYNNPRREWVAIETASDTLLEYLIPPVCRPFDVESVEINLDIRAGSRKVQVFSGTPDNLQLVTELDSPLGEQVISVPVELAKVASEQGRFYLQIDVSEIGGNSQTESEMGEQDDNYLVNRCLVKLKGRRSEPKMAAVTSAK
ncbi:MAG: hypothetical protein RLZZ232_869 [Planctomycetota bacterium]